MTTQWSNKSNTKIGVLETGSCDESGLVSWLDSQLLAFSSTKEAETELCLGIYPWNLFYAPDQGYF